MNSVGIIPEVVMNQFNINRNDVCYSLKLSGLVKRRVNQAPTGKFSGFMAGLSNTINDTFNSAMHRSFLLRMNDGSFMCVTENAQPVRFDFSQISKQLDLAPNVLQFSLVFMHGDYETASFALSKDNFYKSFSGDVKQLFVDFNTGDFENITRSFVTVKISTHCDISAPYKVRTQEAFNSFVAYDDAGIFIVNKNQFVDFGSMLVAYSVEDYCIFISNNNGTLVVTEVFGNGNLNVCESALNLISDMRTQTPETEDVAVQEQEEQGQGSEQMQFLVPDYQDSFFNIHLPVEVMKAKSFLSAVSMCGLAIVAVDDKVFTLRDSVLEECGVFEKDRIIYVKVVSGAVEKYANCAGITTTLSLLPAGYDKIFMDLDRQQPFIMNGDIYNFSVSESGIRCQSHQFEYSDMVDCVYVAEDFNCSLIFKYNGQDVQLTTASSLGIYVANQQEKVFVNAQTKNYSLNMLYGCYYTRFSKNFLASTFSEIFKTRKLINNDIAVGEFIAALQASENDVLRGAFSSLLGKFKSVDDIQSDLIQKVALLEIQRKKIQKVFDEWNLFYPHYMANEQVEWLKKVFGSNISEDALNSEYWKSVAYFKKCLSSANSYVQKNMNEIGSCVNKISSALPDDVKRTDVTYDLRINLMEKKNVLGAGSDILLGVAAGLEVSNVLLKGLSATNPLTLSMTAKMLVSSYTKDVSLRKDIKAFGMQALEWWEIFMSGVCVHIFELTNSINEFNKICLKRDTELFKKLPDDAKAAVKDKLTLSLRKNISDSIDDKFIEVLPQFNMRISNIIDVMKGNRDVLTATLDAFERNLFI